MNRVIIIILLAIAWSGAQHIDNNSSNLEVIQAHFSDSKSTNIDYYPLEIGNYWELIDGVNMLFSYIRNVVSDTTMVNGFTYFVVDNYYCTKSLDSNLTKEYVRKDSSGNIYIYYENKDTLLYDFNVDIGESYPSHREGHHWKIDNKYLTVFLEDTLRAIDFTLCDTLDQDKAHQTIVENIGLFYEWDSFIGVRRNFWGGTINGKEYRELIAGKMTNWFEYYPLNIGNRWIFNELQSGFTIQIEYIIVKDTLLEDGNTYKQISNKGYSSGDPLWESYDYERIDSSGVVYFYEKFPSPTFKQKYVFSNCVGDTFEHYWDEGNYFWVEGKQDSKSPIFKENRIGFSINAYFCLCGTQEIFKKGVGMVEYTGEGTWGLLNGALIDGVVYGDTTIYTSIIENWTKPEDFVLSQNYPNPFNGFTTIKYNIPKPGNIRIYIYSISGQLIKTLLNSTQDGGNHQVTWNGQNDESIDVSSGVYFYSLIIDGKLFETKPMHLLK